MSKVSKAKMLKLYNCVTIASRKYKERLAALQYLVLFKDRT